MRYTQNIKAGSRAKIKKPDKSINETERFLKLKN